MYRTYGNRTPLGITETPHPLDTSPRPLTPEESDDFAALGRPLGIGWENNEIKKLTKEP